MHDPFVQPREPTPEAAMAAIAEEFGCFDDWMDRYGLVIDWGRGLPAFPPGWQDEARRVEGCQSQVWLAAERRDGRLFLAAASDAAIVAGLVAMLLRIYSGRTPEQVLAADAARFLKELDLIGNLSANRGNGIAAMVARIRALAAGSVAAARGGLSPREAPRG
jgi:cysteine desulfuration protein SufE